MTHYSSSRSGFTMVELLIAMGITIIIGAVGISYFYGARSNQQTEVSARQVVTLLKAAQEKSASQENDSRWGVFIANPAGAQGYYVFYQVDEELLAAGGGGIPGTTVQRNTLPAGVIFNPPTSGANFNVVFARGTGLPTGAFLITISLANSQLGKNITVNANGQIEYHDFADDLGEPAS